MANQTLQQAIQNNGSLLSSVRTLLKRLAGKTSEDFVLVDSVDDFPKPQSGVIYLEDNRTYFVTSVVDLLGNRLVGGQNTTIIGGSSENCRIKSTGLGTTALITSEWSLPIRNVTIEAGLALDLDATGNSNQAIDWFGVNFTDCTTVGTIKSYNNVTASLTSGNNHQIGIYVAKNGTVITNSETYVTTSGTGRAENVFCQALVTCATNDYLEVFVENNTTSTDITVTDLSVIISAQN